MATIVVKQDLPAPIEMVFDYDQKSTPLRPELLRTRTRKTNLTFKTDRIWEVDTIAGFTIYRDCVDNVYLIKKGNKWLPAKCGTLEECYSHIKGLWTQATNGNPALL